MRRTMAAYLAAASSALRPALAPAAALAVVVAAPGNVLAAGPTVDVEAYGEPQSSRTVVVGDELARVSGRGRPVEIKIWTSGGEGATYREGQEVGIRFRASRDCYVVIYDIDTEGFLTLLYPDDPYDEGFVRGGRVYRLPGARAEYDLLAEGPPGVEYVAAVAGLVPLAGGLPWYLSESYEAYGYRGHYDLDATVSDVGAVRGDPYVAMRDIAYDILPESIREREYDTDYTYFDVGRKYGHPRYLCYDCHGRVDWLDPYHDSCSVFDIRVDLDWHFVSHPTFCSVAPRFWYRRRPDCPSIYFGAPPFWCSLYPRRLYRAYYWGGLAAAGLQHRTSRTVYPPPRYRGKPRGWARGYSGGHTRLRRYGRGADPGGGGRARGRAKSKVSVSGDKESRSGKSAAKASKIKGRSRRAGRRDSAEYSRSDRRRKGGGKDRKSESRSRKAGGKAKKRQTKKAHERRSASKRDE